MNKLTRAKKLSRFHEFTKLSGVRNRQRICRRHFEKARLLIDNPHAYRDWIIVGYSNVPGF